MLQYKHNFYLFDWISFSTKYHTNPYWLTYELGLDKVKWEEDSGRYKYNKRISFEHINIYYDGKMPDMGILCEMSGQGCRAFETYGTGDYNGLFKELFIHKELVNITRIDIAFDDHEELFNINTLFNDTLKQEFNCKSEEYMCTFGTRGISIQHGRKISKTMVRIYDKAMEQNKQEDGHWIRIELILKDERAKNFVQYYVNNNESLPMIYSGVLNNHLRYVIPSKTDTNKSRWKSKPYWIKFIKEAENIKLFEKPGIEYNEKRLKKYAIDQAGSSMQTYMRLKGIDEVILEIFKIDLEKRNPKYKKLLEQHGIE
ncbi:MAG: replication initiation factor domain-containing protein [Oscillospiraceae bacterium]|nr:replication initiation factor domain-containing protein [Oscillospiraceae bacterium]